MATLNTDPQKNGIIFDTEKGAQDFNHQKALDEDMGDTTLYKYPMRELTTTTDLTKDEYAELNDIPKHITKLETGKPVENPEYAKLKKSYTVPKFAVICDEKGAEDIEKLLPEQAYYEQI